MKGNAEVLVYQGKSMSSSLPVVNFIDSYNFGNADLSRSRQTTESSDERRNKFYSCLLKQSHHMFLSVRI